MDGEEEVIETSDSEEREALRTGQLDYWQHAVDDIRARNPVYAPSSTRFSLLYNVPSPRKRPRVRSMLICFDERSQKRLGSLIHYRLMVHTT